MIHQRIWAHLLSIVGITIVRRTKFVGRARTRDRKTPSPHPSLAEQEQSWLRSSCLNSQDLPGKLVLQKSERCIEFFDIDRKRIPEADIVRRFRPVRGVAALTEAATKEPEPKYLHPKGIRPHFYYPQNGSNHWREWARDAKTPKIFVEGCKKAACTSKFGFPAIGIEGSWGWRSVKHGLLMLPEFNDYEFEGTDVYWIPDRDRKSKAVTDILRASNAFALLLQERMASVHVVWLPLVEGFAKVGVDDFLFHYSRGGKDITAAKAALKELIAETPLWKDFEITDLGNARRWVSMYGGRFRFVAPRRWLVYEDGCWRDDVKLEHQETAKQMFEGMMEDARHAGNSERFSSLRKHVTADRVANVPRLAKSDGAVVTTGNKLDSNPLYVNCKNGTLELPRGKDDQFRFREHSSEDLLTHQVSVAYNPKATCPQFLKALDFWTKSDQALQRTIQQLLGLSCTGIMREQSFIILWGPGATGKSTLIEIVRDVLANYAVTLPAETFLLRRHGQLEERKLARLPGARFASSSETERGGVIDENLIKQITGEDSLAARRLYEEQFDFTPQAKIWLRTNNQPEIRGTGDDIWRRVIALPFGQVIPPERRDKFLKDKLRRELEGIFTWMVEGYVDYATNGIVRAPVVTHAIENYRKEQDVMQRFFEDECAFRPADFVETEIPPRYSVGREQLYMRFSDWCQKNGVRFVMGIHAFKTEILTRFKHLVTEKQLTVPLPGKTKGRKKQERRWVGLTTKTEEWTGELKDGAQREAEKKPKY